VVTASIKDTLIFVLACHYLLIFAAFVMSVRALRICGGLINGRLDRFFIFAGLKNKLRS